MLSWMVITVQWDINAGNLTNDILKFDIWIVFKTFLSYRIMSPGRKERSLSQIVVVLSLFHFDIQNPYYGNVSVCLIFQCLLPFLDEQLKKRNLYIIFYLGISSIQEINAFHVSLGEEELCLERMICEPFNSAKKVGRSQHWPTE